MLRNMISYKIVLKTFSKALRATYNDKTDDQFSSFYCTATTFCITISHNSASSSLGTSSARIMSRFPSRHIRLKPKRSKEFNDITDKTFSPFAIISSMVSEFVSFELFLKTFLHVTRNFSGFTGYSRPRYWSVLYSWMTRDRWLIVMDNNKIR